jgi:cyclohexadienyl dehydratase
MATGRPPGFSERRLPIIGAPEARRLAARKRVSDIAPWLRRRGGGFVLRGVRLFLVLACVAYAAPVLAQKSRLDDILERGVLRVGTTGDYRPFTARDKASGAYSGFDIDMAEALGAALGVRVEFAPTSWPSLARDFDAGAFDIAMGGVSVTLERAKKGFFSAPYLREGKTPIARCADRDKYQTLADIDRPDVKVIANPGGTNERFDRAHLHAANIVLYSDNLTIFDALAKGDADLMITDASETRFQQKLHPGALCAIHPDKPFDFAEKAYWMARDEALKAFVDQWLHLSIENGAFAAVYAKWFE